MRHASFLLSLFPLLLIAGCGKEEKARPVPEVGFVVVRQSSVPIVTELTGRTSAYEISEVRPQITGIIRKRLFREGETVRAGQTLYQIDPSLYRAASDEAEANLASAVASAEAARARADRYRPLAEMEAVSRQDYVDAAAAARQAGAAVAQARAALDTARINLRFTDVPAPIGGHIGRSLFTVGALVTANQAEPLAVIQRLDPIYVDIQQTSGALLKLRRALGGGGAVPTRATVRLTLEDGSDYPLEGVVEFTETVVSPTTGTTTLRARFPNPQGLLLPGMFVRARFAQAVTVKALLVPQAAVRRNPKGEASVLVVGKDDTAELRPITTERSRGADWIVTDGLKPGERVIVEGTSRARPGEPVKPVPAGSPPPSSPPPRPSGTG